MHGFIQTIRKAAYRDLDKVYRMMWSWLADGKLDPDNVEALTGAIEARRSEIRASRTKHPRNRKTCTERTEQRRKLAAYAPLPPDVAKKFTVGEQAAILIVLSECKERGLCDLHIARIANRAHCSENTVRSAIRKAVEHGLISREVRRTGPFSSRTNVLRVVAQRVMAWWRKRVQNISALRQIQYIKGEEGSETRFDLPRNGDPIRREFQSRGFVPGRLATR